MVVVHRRVDSETLHLPELREFFGKTVEITISEQSMEQGSKRWDALRDAAGKDLIDPERVGEYRRFDRESQRSEP